MYVSETGTLPPPREQLRGLATPPDRGMTGAANVPQALIAEMCQTLADISVNRMAFQRELEQPHHMLAAALDITLT